MLFGWRRVSVGSPPCWHRDPTCGVIIQPGIPAHKLNHRALPDGADARSIWEINRWAEMVRLAMHDVDAEFVAEMRDLGLGELTADRLVELKIHDVDADLVRELREMGFLHEKGPVEE